jgi:hypothetical protein
VPLLGLAVNKSHASVIVLILSCGAFYWFAASLLHNNLLLFKMLILLALRYGHAPENAWHLRHPSFLTSSILSIAMTSDANLLLALYGTGLYYVINLIGYFLPLFFAWKISNSLAMSLAQKMIFCAFVLFLLLPTMAINYMRRHRDEETLVGLLERDLSSTEEAAKESSEK